MGRIMAAVKQVAYHLPDLALTNEQLAHEFGDWDAEKIAAKTGIISRRVAAPGECASDLGVRAARGLFDQGGHAAEDIDFLLFCTQGPDYFLPTTACLVHESLGLREDCAAIDINQGCSGYVYGLALAKGLVENGVARNVLLITADTYTKFINRKDRGTRTIFGDGAAATLVGVAPAGPDGDDPIGPFVFGTDGKGAPNLIVSAGAMRRPRSPEPAVGREDAAGNVRTDANLYMNGAEVFAFALRAVPLAVSELLRKAGIGAADVDSFVLHQANKFMLERLRDKLEIPPQKFMIDMADTGNTVSSSIPIVLSRAADRADIRPGDRVMLVGFGVGYSWAAALIRAQPSGRSAVS